ncbi:FAD-dependent monooxygenase [Solirubrobacter phytolaccae]|uniref:FAD-dependent monooxygenase n=1 Tax=Solirubrobacter phytolaccae TaxID=1404360 RepID=A0A9X3NC40_9ACTN|nr:FAD-dependent monooxygenase [Solirubrobacter phytolaccae]MDA0182334.1 FAD-dependent monooxygenase [Solirubrobacter phytolaccae]
MRIAIAGGGPGGLYLSILLKRLDPAHEVVVHERNAPDDTFGFGVVFSDETLAAFEAADPESYAEIAASFVRWSEIDVHYRGEVVTSGGHGFSAMGRKALLGILQRRAAALGVDLRFGSEVSELEGDLVVAADGVNSTLRARYGFEPSLDRRRATYAWFGTDHVFDAFTFIIAETPGGVVQVHAYPYSDVRSTFIVESTGVQLDRAQCEDLFGYRLIENRTRWINFVTVRNPVWRRGNVVLLGDAAHTAHFSIGSGTKLAMEDAISLAWAVREGDLDAYEAERRPIVESTQRAAQGSLEWFEGIGRYVRQEPRQFAFNLLTRSRRITFGELRMRDPEFVEGAPPMFTPLTLRGLELRNRVVVSPMDMYTSVEGTPGDFHLVHLGARAIGGAGLVMTEMICTSAEGRITPGCGGLYRDEHVDAWQRIVDFVHAHSRSAIGAQLGHAGRKGATKLMWEGDNEPLDDGGWPLIAPSPVPWSDAHQTPREMTRADLDDVVGQFVAATERAAACGFDLLEIHMAHGYLLSSFLSPLTNVRDDAYGADRAKFPLEVFSACRAVWPAEKPMSVRISATDWVDGGFDGDDAVAFAHRLRDAGCDIVDVSTGQVSPDQQPAYGRSFQTPYADRIRHEAEIPVIAVGAISSYDDVNTIILAGRADLCALARPHLWDPHWTLHAAADQGVDMEWIPQYRSGAREPQTGKDVRRMPLRRFDTQVPA